MDELELVPCPFCGGEAIMRHHRRHGDWYHVECGGPKYDGHPYVSSQQFRTPEEAAETWNRRDYVPKRGGRKG